MLIKFPGIVGLNGIQFCCPLFLSKERPFLPYFLSNQLLVFCSIFLNQFVCPTFLVLLRKAIHVISISLNLITGSNFNSTLPYRWLFGSQCQVQDNCFCYQARFLPTRLRYFNFTLGRSLCRNSSIWCYCSIPSNSDFYFGSSSKEVAELFLPY